MSHYSWIPKAVAQKAVSTMGLLPLYHRAQRRGGRLRAFHPSARSEYAAKLVIDTRDFVPLAGASLIEIGTGWVPVVPLLLHLMGAARCLTFDLNRHLQPELTLSIVPLLAECFPDLVRRTGMDPAPWHDRLELLRGASTFEALLERAGIEYRAPGDASQTGLPAASADIVYSNLVLEHVTPAALGAIHREAARVLRPTGVAWHNVDFSDHYAATNKQLLPINFLRYSDRFWNLLGQNDILYQNRWRRSHHVAEFEAAGLSVARAVDHRVDELRPVLDDGFPLQPEYAGIDHDELCVTSTRFVLKPTPAAAARA